MSNEADERIELLITRKLDGVITDDEGWELDRAMIRNPEYRRWLEASERIDAVCADALRDEIVGVGGRHCVEVPAQNVTGRGLLGRLWWLVPAVAACLALFVATGLLDVVPGQRNPRLADGGPKVVDKPVLPVLPGSPGWESARTKVRGSPTRAGSTGFPVGMRPDVLDRRRDSDFYGIVGEDGRVYVIELERIRSYHFPYGGHPGVRLARNDL